ncbi:MAG: hypothetical protein WCG79_10535 [Verrucomicrobiota bacterium]
MKTVWMRTAYFLIGVVLTTICLGLAVGLFMVQRFHSTPAIYGTCGFLCFLAILTASAFRAAFRNPPWWFISPEKIRQATLHAYGRWIVVLLWQQMKIARKQLKLTEKKIKLAEKNVKVAEKILRITTQGAELEAAAPASGSSNPNPRND